MAIADSLSPRPVKTKRSCHAAQLDRWENLDSKPTTDSQSAQGEARVSCTSIPMHGAEQIPISDRSLGSAKLDRHRLYIWDAPTGPAHPYPPMEGTGLWTREKELALSEAWPSFAAQGGHQMPAASLLLHGDLLCLDDRMLG